MHGGTSEVCLWDMGCILRLLKDLEIGCCNVYRIGGGLGVVLRIRVGGNLVWVGAVKI